MRTKYTVEYVDELKEGFGGVCEYPWYPLLGTCKIKLLKKYKNDTGLLNHEIKQIGRAHV